MSIRLFLENRLLHSCCNKIEMLQQAVALLLQQEWSVDLSRWHVYRSTCHISIYQCVTYQSDSFSRTGCCTLAAITNITTRLQQQSTRFAIFLKITDCQEKSSRLLSHVWQSPMHMRHIHMCLIHMCLIHMCLIHMCLIHTWLIHMWLIHMCLIHMWLIHMCLMKEESQREQSFCNLFENNRLSREIFTHARGIFKIYSLTCDIWHMREESWRLWRLWEESWRLLHVYQS